MKGLWLNYKDFAPTGHAFFLRSLCSERFPARLNRPARIATRSVAGVAEVQKQNIRGAGLQCRDTMLLAAGVPSLLQNNSSVFKSKSGEAASCY